MAKAVAKSRKAAAKSAAKSKSSARPKAAAAPSARKALKAPAKPAAKVAAKKAAVRKPAAEAVKSGKWVYTSADGTATGKAGLRDLLASKVGNRTDSANLGLPVPPRLAIPT